MNVLCLCDPVLVPEGCRGGFCEKLLAASLCPAELVPASSKVDLLLAKAKPSSSGGTASGVMYLRGEKTPVWSSLFLKGFTPWKGPTLKQFMKSCSQGRAHTGEVCIGLSPWEGTDAGAGEECEVSCPWREISRDNVWGT